MGVSGAWSKIKSLGSGLLRRTRLDELPQIWNVIRGDLSLVGPTEFAQVGLYGEEIKFYNVRHLVKPGLSGWAQIYGTTSSRYWGRETKTNCLMICFILKTEVFCWI